MTATHLLMKMMKISLIMRATTSPLHSIILILSACSFIIEGNRLLIRCWWRIGIIIEILRGLHKHSFDHWLLLLLLRINEDLGVTLPLIWICTSWIRGIHYPHGCEDLRLLLDQVGIQLLLKKGCQQLKFVLRSIVHVPIAYLRYDLTFELYEYRVPWMLWRNLWKRIPWIRSRRRHQRLMCFQND